MILLLLIVYLIYYESLKVILNDQVIPIKTLKCLSIALPGEL
jgi:hypothetical protein